MVVGIVVIVIAAGILGDYFYIQSLNAERDITITSTVWQISGSCQSTLTANGEFAGVLSNGEGFTVPALLDNAGPSGGYCTVNAVTTTTAGFGAPGTVTPVIVCGGNAPDGTPLNVQMTAPSTAYDGALVLTVDVGSSGIGSGC